MIALFIKGGWVMFAILGISIMAMTIIIERMIFFYRIRGNDEQLISLVARRLKEHDIEACIKACETEKSLLASIISDALNEWSAGIERLEEVFNFEGNRAVERMEKHLRGLAVAIQGAPLLGLLGTVTGLIRAFMRVEQMSGETNVASLAGGIWEALLTTAFGLIVAIPALFAYHMFESRVTRYANLIRDTGEKLVSLRRAATK